MRYFLPLLLTAACSPPPHLLADNQTQPLVSAIEAETGVTVPSFAAYVVDSIGAQDKIGMIECVDKTCDIYISMEDDVRKGLTSDVLRTALAHELIHLTFGDSGHASEKLWWALEGYEAGVLVHDAGLLRRVWRDVNDDERGF